MQASTLHQTDPLPIQTPLLTSPLLLQAGQSLPSKRPDPLHHQSNDNMRTQHKHPDGWAPLKHGMRNKKCVRAFA